MTDQKKKKEHDIACRVNEEQERREAYKKCRADYDDGLKRASGYIPEGSTPIEVARHFLSQRIADLDKGEISSCEFLGWDSVIYICAFNMEYKFTGVTGNGIDEATGQPLLIIYGASDFLEEYEEQQSLIKLLSTYFTAGAAFANRIGSSTYQEWIDLLIFTTYDILRATQIEKMDVRVKKLEALMRLNRRLWADNEAYKRNQMIALAHPVNVKKRAKKCKTR